MALSVDHRTADQVLLSRRPHRWVSQNRKGNIPMATSANQRNADKSEEHEQEKSGRRLLYREGHPRLKWGRERPGADDTIHGECERHGC